MADVTHANSPALVGTTVNVTASHEGLNAVPFNFVANGVTVSASTIIFLAKIPHGATITRLDMSGWIASAGNATVDVGLVGEATASSWRTRCCWPGTCRSATGRSSAAAQ